LFRRVNLLEFSEEKVPKHEVVRLFKILMNISAIFSIINQGNIFSYQIADLWELRFPDSEP